MERIIMKNDLLTGNNSPAPSRTSVRHLRQPRRPFSRWFPRGVWQGGAAKRNRCPAEWTSNPSSFSIAKQQAYNCRSQPARLVGIVKSPSVPLFGALAFAFQTASHTHGEINYSSCHDGSLVWWIVLFLPLFESFSRWIIHFFLVYKSFHCLNVAKKCFCILIIAKSWSVYNHPINNK